MNMETEKVCLKSTISMQKFYEQKEEMQKYDEMLMESE